MLTMFHQFFDIVLYLLLSTVIAGGAPAPTPGPPMAPLGHENTKNVGNLMKFDEL